MLAVEFAPKGFTVPLLLVIELMKFGLGPAR